MLFALFLVALLGIAAFVVDLARVYALQRFERSVADAAALAGAQDLQIPNSRSVTNNSYIQARIDARDLLVRELGGTGTPAGSGTDASGITYNCDPGALGVPDASTKGTDIVDCHVLGTPYYVSIRTPSPSSMTVDSAHAVQVTVRQPAVSLTLSRIPPFNQATWNVGKTSVAGLVFGGEYAVVTLQPPNIKHNFTDANLCKDLVVKGTGTVLNVTSGDIGSNTSVATTNSGIIMLSNGFYIDHLDDLTNASCGLFTNPTWAQVGGLPQGQRIFNLIDDPGYPYANFGKANTFSAQTAGVVGCSDTGYGPFPTDWAAKFPLATTTCYQPGVYNLPLTQPFTIGSSQTAYLMPGAYSFPSGLSVQGSLGGGLVAGQEGVVLVLPENLQSGGTLTLNANNAVDFDLNVGSNGCGNASCRATPAVDSVGNPVTTDGTTKGVVLTIEVLRDDTCFSGDTPQNVSSCALQHNTINLAGSGSLQVAGAMYGPSDNMSINGNSSQQGYVGQIWSWTVTYTGGSTLNEEFGGSISNGDLRLDTACSGSIGFGLGPGIVCNNP